jgi:hypothetical protein
VARIADGGAEREGVGVAVSALEIHPRLNRGGGNVVNPGGPALMAGLQFGCCPTTSRGSTRLDSHEEMARRFLITPCGRGA